MRFGSTIRARQLVAAAATSTRNSGTAAEMAETSKRCARCKAEKPRSEFAPWKRAKDGLDPCCRPCRKSYFKEWKEKQALATREAECTPRFG